MLFFTGVIIFIALLNTVVYYLRLHLEEKEYGERTISSAALLPDNGCRRFSLTEIQFATQNFNEALVIGKGGFGKVYKGIIDSGASTVAIKRLDIGSSQGAPEFWTEIEMLSKFRHSHLVSLIGYCNDQNEMIIVYEYMPSGSLEDNLYKIGRSNGQNRRSLPWIQRLKICLGAARGLDYLHTGTSTEHRVIHRDVKSSNILLDENMEAKISDFGLSKIGPINQPCTDVCTHVKGTFGYLDPEYFLTHRLTKKSDVYAFGVVLFEMLCGRPAVDSRLDEEQWGLAGWSKQCVKEGKISQFVDPSLNGSILSNCLDEFSKIACQCLHNSSKRRPTMGEVVTKLEFALAMQEMPDTSLLEDEIIRPFGTYDNQEITNSSTEQGISNPAPGRGTSTEQEVVNARNTGSSFGQFDSFWRLGGPSLAYSYARPTRKRTFVKRLHAFFSLKYPSTTGAFERPYLNWDHRYKIIRGVARGVLYLHEESPFQIFHRDLKPSNILLGSEFDPKISDFGLANLQKQRVSECSTDRIAGTLGYMAPEYVMHGQFSVKSEVFSFGMLLLEIIRGQKMMNHFSGGDNSDNNLQNAWRNWREGTPLNFADLTLRADLNDGADVVRCIQIGLLCIQDKAVERPTMGSVLLMLSSSSTSLPEPSEPAFLTRVTSGRNNIYQESISDGETDMWNHYSGSGEDSVTDLYPR